MTNATNANTVPSTLDRAEVSRSVALVRHELTELFNDAKRARPFFATSKKEAEAKLNSALKVLNEFAASLDAIKKR